MNLAHPVRLGPHLFWVDWNVHWLNPNVEFHSLISRFVKVKATDDADSIYQWDWSGGLVVAMCVLFFFLLWWWMSFFKVSLFQPLQSIEGIEEHVICAFVRNTRHPSGMGAPPRTTNPPRLVGCLNSALPLTQLAKRKFNVYVIMLYLLNDHGPSF